jgi:hypothetical protein
MSLHGLAAARGSRLTVRRYTITKNPDMTVNRSWSDHLTEVPMLLESASVEKVQRLFGREATATVLGYMDDSSTDIVADDGVRVVTGFLAGKNLRVAGVRPLDYPKPRGSLVVALELTTETF